MAGSGSGIFLEPDDYCAQLPGTRELLLVAPAPFQARLAWVDLRRLRLLRAQETAVRVRYVSLPPDRAFISFPVHRDTTLICGGTEARPNDIIFHARGERFHERTAAPARWGILSVRVDVLSLLGRTLVGNEISPPAAGLIIRPRPADRLQLLRLHARAIRLVETKIDLIGHPEVSRALEDDLIWALLACLSAAGRQEVRPLLVQGSIMVRFEEALAACPDHIPGHAALRDAIGITGSALQSCCLKVLGMSLARYLYLRRLAMVRSLLVRAASGGGDTSDLPRQHGFAGFHHFVAEYLRAFGSIPSQFQ